MIAIAEETGTSQAETPATESKAKKKATRSPRVAHSAPKKSKAGKKATPAKKAPKGAKKAPASQAGKKGAREGSKTETILELLKRPEGATAKELLKVTGWQPHSLRGFVSGTLGKKMGLSVTSTKGEDGERSYSVKA